MYISRRYYEIEAYEISCSQSSSSNNSSKSMNIVCVRDYIALNIECYVFCLLLNITYAIYSSRNSKLELFSWNFQFEDKRIIYDNYMEAQYTGFYFFFYLYLNSLLLLISFNYTYLVCTHSYSAYLTPTLYMCRDHSILSVFLSLLLSLSLSFFLYRSLACSSDISLSPSLSLSLSASLCLSPSLSASLRLSPSPSHLIRLAVRGASSIHSFSSTNSISPIKFYMVDGRSFHLPGDLLLFFLSLSQLSATHYILSIKIIKME